MSTLTAGAIPRLARSNQANAVDSNFTPIIQILKVMPIAPTGAQQQRFRVILSDGTHFMQGMLASQNNDLVINQAIKDLSLIRIKDCMCNIVQNKTLLIILSLDVIQRDFPNKIGNPADFAGQENTVTTVPATNVPQRVPSHQASAPTGNGMQNQSTNMYGMNNNTGMGSIPNTNYPGMNSMASSNPTHTTTHVSPYANTASNNMYNRPNAASSSTNSLAMPSIVRSNVMQQHFTPINQLNQYQNRWTIKARVTSKSDVRTWSNAKGEGKLFSVELADSSGQDIRATFFKEAVDQFEPMLQVDKVYTFSGGKLKTANLQFNTCKSGFEITFDQNAAIALAEDDIQTQALYNFVAINSLEGMDVGAGVNVDIIAIVKQVSPPSTIVSKKSGQEMFKSDLILVDDTNCEITCTLWGERAQRAEMQLSGQPVVAFRRLRLSEYGGRSLSASGSSVMTVQPTNLPEAERLRMWWHHGGANQGGGRSLSASMGGGGAGRFPSFEERKTIASIRGESMGLNPEKADWINFKASFTFIKSDKDGGPWYTACPNANEPCKNRYKVTASADGGYHCDHCNQTYPNCVRKFIFSATASDDTCTSWISVFDDQAQVLLGGAKADELYSELELGNQGAFDAFFTRANYTDWIMTCKVKQEMANDEMKLKTSLMSLHPMDYAKEGRSLLNAIIKL